MYNKRLTTQKDTMSYTPTGYPAGRPRTGEIRPITAKMLAAAATRAREKKALGKTFYNAIKAAQSREYYHSNLDTVRATARRKYYRNKAIKEAQGLITIG